MRLLHDYIQENGRPRALYVDKYSVFRVNQGTDRSKKTQFTRAMSQLEIEVICAHSPQAKGRIERLNGTLQDRLVKELRLKGISSIEDANAFLPKFLENFNKRFYKAPASPINAHRPLKHGTDLNKILCYRESRKVSKNLEIHYKNRIIQLQAFDRARRLRGVAVEVLGTLDGELFIEYKGEILPHKEFKELVPQQPEVKDHKQIVERENRHSWRPGPNHPWRRSQSWRPSS